MSASRYTKFLRKKEKFIYKNKAYCFLKFPAIEPPYIIFDILKKESKKTKGVHVLKLNYKQYITIGRGSGNDIRMTDISVSRAHAVLKLTNHGLFIEDKNSKFGTLVLVQKPFPILKDRNNIFLQIGRSVINCQVKANWKYVMRLSKYKEEPIPENKYSKNFFTSSSSVYLQITIAL